MFACFLAVLMLFSAVPLMGVSAANACAHSYEAQGAVAVTYANGKYVVGDETYKCSLCGGTKKEKVYLTDDFNKYADAAKEITASGEYSSASSKFKAVKSAYDAMLALTTGTHFSAFVDRRIKAVEDAVDVFDKNDENNINSYTVTFVYLVGESEKETYDVYVKHGATAVAPSPSSTFYWNAGRHYEFKGWDKKLDNVKGDMTVTAQYKSGIEHDFVDKSDKIDSTCAVEGQEKVEVCRTCGYEKGGEPIAKKAHTWGAWTDNQNAWQLLLGAKATHTRQCSVCLQKYTECSKEDHNLKTVEAKAASCFEEGWAAYSQCKDCDYNNKVVIPAIGDHTVVVDAAKEPTCTATGLTEGKHCSVCKEVLVAQEPVSANGHDFSNEIMADAYLATKADCETPATYYKSCSVCGMVKKDNKDTFQGEALGHDYTAKVYKVSEGDKRLASAATCKEPAKYYYSCSRCDDVSDELTFEYGSKLGHKWGAWKNNADGKTKTRTCDRGCTETTCIKNHNTEIIQAVAATCNAAGHSQYSKCKTCGLTTGYVEYPAGHKFGKTESAVTENATCLVAGAKEEVRYCVREDCKKFEVTTAVVNALGHDYGNFVDDENGKTHTKTCKRDGCLASVDGHTVTANHSVVKVDAKDVTCLEDGCTAGEKCTVCSYNTSTVVKSDKQHKEEVLPAKAATCKETGLTEGKKCSVCGEILVKQEETPKLEHTVVDIPAVEPTCSVAGSTAGKKCSVCGEIIEQPQEIAKTAHTEEIVPAVAATCTEAGATEGKKCSVCGEVITPSEVIPALGHDMIDEPDLPATCTVDGYKGGKHCSRCDYRVEPEVVKAAGSHAEEDIPASVATCTTDGTTGGKRCSVCGEILVEPEINPALGHSFETVITKATATADGKIVKTCTACGEVEETVISKVSTVVLTKTKLTDNGKAQTPAVAVKDAKGNLLTEGADYEITYANNAKPGKATVTVKFVGDNYSGTKTLSFVIVPAATGKISATQTSTSLKVSWSAVEGAAGYRVQLYNGNKLVKSRTTTKKTWTFKKLAKGTKYKVVVTAYVTVNDAPAYGATKSLTTATKTAKVTGVTAASGSKNTVKVKWNKVTGATGYTISYSLKKDGKFKTVTVSSKKNSVNLKNLKSGRVYYVKVTANKRVSGNVIKATPSNIVSVTVK